MFRHLSLAALAFVGLSLTAPSTSQAQTPVGIQVRVGPASVSYLPGYQTVAAPCVVPAPFVTTPTAVFTAPVYSPWYWNGYRWLRHERFEHHNYHYGHHR